MAKIDDAAILKRAKELCEEDGAVWDWFAATTPDARVLDGNDRREYLMRARNQLINEAENAQT